MSLKLLLFWRNLQNDLSGWLILFKRQENKEEEAQGKTQTLCLIFEPGDVANRQIEKKGI